MAKADLPIWADPVPDFNQPCLPGLYEGDNVRSTDLRGFFVDLEAK